MTPKEELANSISHWLGFAGALAAIPVLVVSAVSRGDAAGIVGSSIFGATVLLLYLASAGYHAVPPSRPLKARLQKIDHAAIYLLIAGTYTPFTLGVLRGAWGWTLFGLVWGAAAVGVGSKLIAGVRHPKVSTAMYLVMGWLMVIAIHPLVVRMPPAGIGWLAAGGLLYTGGVAFYGARRLPYHHFIWHLFVLGGTTCHFFAVLWYAGA